MEKNPFSIYDFMGYLFPGALLMYIICYLCGPFDPYNIFDLKDFIQAFHMDTSIDAYTIGRLAMFVVISYILGHMVSYLSSLTVELVFRKTFGYPSKYLFSKSRITWKEMFNNYIASMATVDKKYIKKFVVLLKILLAIVVSPIMIMNFTLGHWLGINVFVTRSLDKNLQHIIEEKNNIMLKKIKVNPHSKPEDDSHRMVLHYVYHNIPSSQHKTENYIALYGFLRAISFIFCIAFDCLLIYAITTIDFDAAISWKLISELGILFFVAYISYLGFTKFYRKYTLENYMALVTDTTLVDKEKI